MQWYEVENIEEVDSPALLIYTKQVKQNIELAMEFVGGKAARLRPHIKTHKSAFILGLLKEAGITKVKCATIAEAELSLTAGVEDVLLAYQPVGPKVKRLLNLKEKYMTAELSCLVDNKEAALYLSEQCCKYSTELSCFVDLNAGQNRTGVEKDKFQELLQFCNSLPGIQVVGMHVYDGHIDDESFIVRTSKAEEILGFVLSQKEKLPSNFKVVVGGTTTFPVYAQTEGLECSPGTFIYWDAGYKRLYKEQNFQIAALIATRVISKITDHLLCLDLGYKSISSENALEHRMAFMGRKAKIVKQYEEHLVVKVEDACKHKMGEVWYISPVHICPTVALYDCIQLIEDHQFIGSQPTAGRQRLITV